MSKKKTKSSSTSSSTGTVTPQAPGWIQEPAKDYFSQVRSLLSSAGPAAQPANALQTGGFSMARNMTGVSPGMNDAISGTRTLTGYTPDTVTAGQLRDTDLTSYLNPYTSEVIDRSLLDLDRFRQGAISGNQSAATMAGGYGGSRHGVVDAQTNEAALREAGSLSAGLRQTGFESARAAALADITNKLGVDTGNADRNLAGAGFRLGANQQLGNLGLASDENARANAALQVGLGGVERDIAKENDPAQQRISYLTQLAQLLGFDPEMFIGQTMSSTGQQSGTQTQGGGFTFGWSPNNGFSVGYG